MIKQLRCLDSIFRLAGDLNLRMGYMGYVNYNSSVALFGGYNGSDMQNATYWFDPTQRAWQRLEAVLAEPKSAFTAMNVDLGTFPDCEAKP